MDPQDPTSPTGPTEIVGSPGLRPPGPRDPVAARVGKFALYQKVGEGGMGEVWKAWDADLGRWVALKFLKGGDEAEVKRFRREAQMAARLQHPGIASIYEVGEEGGRHYIAMQFIDGPTLREFRERDPRVHAALLAEAARAVQAAHDLRIVHRDLKPDNFLVGTRGVGRAVFVTDFGLARPAQGGGRVTVSGVVLGTPGYMAPEQAAGETLDARTDVWGLAATLYFLLVRRPPFDNANILRFLRAVQDFDPVPPRRFQPSVPPDLERIVMKGLEKRPVDRYPTARDFADDLDRFLRGEPVLAHPPSTAYRLRRFLARRRTGVLAVAVALVAGSAVLWAVTRGGPTRIAVSTPTPSALPLRPSDETFVLEELQAVGPAIDKADRSFYVRGAEYRDIVRRLEEPRARIERALVRVPDHPALLLARAQVLELEGRLEDAERDLRRAAGIDRKSATIRYRLGRLLMLQFWREAIRMTEGEQDRQAVIARTQERLKEAARLLKEAVEAGLDDPLLRALAEALRSLAASDFSGAETAAAQGVDKFGVQAGAEDFHLVLAQTSTDPGRGLVHFGRALEIRPISPLILMLRGVYRGQVGDAAGAIEDSSAALALDPELFEALMNRGSFRRQLGRLEDARDDYDRVVQLRPTWALARVARALLRMDQGDGEGGLVDAREAQRLAPALPEGHFAEGRILGELGELAAAERKYDAAIALDARNPRYYSNRADCRRRVKNLAGAVEDATKALELAPAWPEALAIRAFSRFELGDKEGARADAEHLLRVVPATWPKRPVIQSLLDSLRD